MIYLIFFSMTTGLFLLAEKVEKNQRVFVEVLAVILLCLLAGQREYGVGTDTTVYFREVIDAAITSRNLEEYMAHEWVNFGWSHHRVSQYEIGFTLFVYLISQMFRSIAVTQFAVQFLILFPVYITLKRKKEVPLWFGMLVYELLFFNMSLNLIRQYVALSFSLLSTQLWMDKRKVGCAFALASACSFHKSALLTLIAIVLWEYIRIDGKVESRLRKKLDPPTAKMVSVVFVGMICLLSIDLVATFLQKTSWARLAWYLSGDLKFVWNQLIKLLPPLLLMVMNLRHMGVDRREAVFYLTVLVLSVLLLQLISITPQSGRIADYFLIYSVISYPLVAQKGMVSRFLILGYMVFYWLFYYGFQNAGETMPYRMIGL